ncbi:MAG: hypothetical protein JWN88_1622 [Frankiales bacterium]|nr:hypothetical protein [Frankiales bacterium]
MSGPAGSVHVRRHSLTLHAYGGSPSGAAAEGALLGHDFATRLGQELAGTGAPDGYWVIRRLEVQAVVSQAWSPRAVSGEVARATARRVGSAVASGSGGDEVLWWPDRTAFLASFLLDAAEGRAEDRWEYAQFADARRSSGPFLLHVARQEPDAVLDALLAMELSSLRRVLAMTSEADGSQLLDLLGGDVSVTPRRDLVLEAVGDLAGAGGLPPAGAAPLLVALVAARCSGKAVADVATPAREIASLLGLLLRSGSSASRLLEALATGRWADAVGLADDTDAVLAFVSWPTDQRGTLATSLGLRAPDRSGGADRLTTPFGGMFLLLPLLDELWDWSAATGTWPSLEAVPASRLARLLVMTAVLGGGTSAAPAVDPVLRLALGVPQTLSGEELLSWWERLPASAAASFEGETASALPAQADPLVRLAPALRAGPADVVDRAADHLLRSLAGRLPGMANASAGYLARNVLDLDATVVLEPGGAVVELGAAPLGVLLSLAGVNRGSFQLAEGWTWTLTTRG